MERDGTEEWGFRSRLAWIWSQAFGWIVLERERGRGPRREGGIWNKGTNIYYYFLLICMENVIL